MILLILINDLAKFLQETFSVKIETRENILKFSSKDTALKIAECKIFNPRKDFEKHIPSNEEILFEESNAQA
jgi:hypothetical protein